MRHQGDRKGPTLDFAPKADGPSLRVSLEALVYGIAPIDPVTFIAAPSRLVIAALAACIAPAVRALRVDPAVTLRQE